MTYFCLFSSSKMGLFIKYERKERNFIYPELECRLLQNAIYLDLHFKSLSNDIGIYEKKCTCRSLNSPNILTPQYLIVFYLYLYLEIWKENSQQSSGDLNIFYPVSW